MTHKYSLLELDSEEIIIDDCKGLSTKIFNTDFSISSKKREKGGEEEELKLKKEKKGKGVIPQQQDTGTQRLHENVVFLAA